jgi:hypothetical protein
MAKLSVADRHIEEPEQPQEDEATAKRYISGTMDAMLVFNDPATQAQRSLKINAYIFSDDNVEGVNKAADRNMAVLERQFLRHDLKRLYKAREDHLNTMKLHVDYMTELAARKENRAHGVKGTIALNSQELDRLKNSAQTTKGAQKILADIEDQIANHKKECGLV